MRRAAAWEYGISSAVCDQYRQVGGLAESELGAESSALKNITSAHSFTFIHFYQCSKS